LQLLLGRLPDDAIAHPFADGNGGEQHNRTEGQDEGRDTL
jgi:hypothetical protein